MKRVLLLLVLISQFIYGQEILQRNNASGINYSLTTQYTAVKFTANDNYTVGAVEIQAKFNKLIFNSNQWVYGNIYDDNGNKPGKQIIQGISSKVTAIPSIFGQVNLLTNAILNKNTVYWLVIRLDFASPENSLICNSDTLGQGAISRDGITWTVNKVQLNVVIKGRPYNPPVQGNTEASQATKIISLSGDMTKNNSNNVLKLKRDLYGPYIASGDLLYLQDNSHSIVTGAAFVAEIDSVIRIKLNPRAQGNETAYKFDTKEDVAGNLLEIAKKGITKVKVDSSGTIDAKGFTMGGKNILDSIKSTNDSLTVKFNEYAKKYDVDTAKSNLRNEVNEKFNAADTLNAQKFSIISDSLARNSMDIQTNKQSALDSLYNHIILINAQYDSLKSHNLRLLGLIDSLKKKVSDTDTSGRWQPKGIYTIPGDTLLSLAYLKALLNYKLPSSDTTNFRSFSNLKYIAEAGTVTSGSIPYFNSTTGKALGASGVYWDAVNSRFNIGTALTSPVIGKPVAFISENFSGISGVEMSNRSDDVSADFRFIISDATGHYFAFSQPGTGNSNTLFGLVRSSADFIFNNGGTTRNLAIATVNANDLIFITNSLKRIVLSSAGALSMYDDASTPIQRMIFNPLVTDGASAVAYSFDTKNTLATSGAKLLSIRSGGMEKVYITYLGKIYCSGGADFGKVQFTSGGIYNFESIYLLNKAGTNWLPFATRNTSGSEAVYDLSNVGTISASSTVTAAQFSLSALNTAPASSTATGTTGEIRIVDGYIYVCVATNTWKRTSLSSW